MSFAKMFQLAVLLVALLGATNASEDYVEKIECEADGLNFTLKDDSSLANATFNNPNWSIPVLVIKEDWPLGEDCSALVAGNSTAARTIYLDYERCNVSIAHPEGGPGIVTINLVGTDILGYSFPNFTFSVSCVYDATTLVSEITTAPYANTSSSQHFTTPTPVPGHCESEQWTYKDGHCYWSSVLNGVSGGGAGANWYKALVTCRSLQSNLVAVHSPAQNEALYPLTCAASVWLGLAATGNVTVPTEGWEWTDLSRNDFSRWASKYPADGFGCSYQSTNRSDWFNDRDCQRGHMPFICEKRAETQDPSSGAARQWANRIEKTNGTTCDPGWTLVKGSCYLVASKSVDYFAAELDCRRRGSKIASIREEGVSGFLLIGLGDTCQDLWIGLVNVDPSRMTDRASWQWDAREPFDLDNWPYHAVPFDDRRKLCTAISTAGYWYNQHCWTPNRYVCKKPPVAA